MHVHAFSALEIWQGATTLGVPLDEYLTRLRDEGLASLPGTAAEILDAAITYSSLCYPNGHDRERSQKRRMTRSRRIAMAAAGGALLLVVACYWRVIVFLTMVLLYTAWHRL